MFRKLGAVVYRRRRWVVAAWFVVAIVGIVAQGPLAERVSAEFTGSERIESARVLERLNETAPTGGDIAIVVDGVGVDPAGPPAEVAEILAELAAIDGVVSVVDPWTAGPVGPQLTATDGRAALVVVSYVNGLDLEAEHALTDAVVELANELEGSATGAGTVTDVLVGGEPIVLQEFETQAEEDLLRGEAIAIPIALIAMVFIFGGVRAAGMPLAVAAAGFLTAGVALLGATFVLDSVSVFAINVVSMLGLGLGIDYGLLLVSRFREERANGEAVGRAVETTVATAGITVVFSALTVAVAMSGMFVFQDPTMTSFGVGGLSAVIFSMAASLTLLPALLGMFGSRIRPAKVQAAGTGAFYRLSRRVQRFALPILFVVGTGLALLATPFLDANLENGDARSLPRSSEARAAALTLADRFPSRGAEPIVVIADVHAGTAEAQTWIGELAALDGVAGIQPRHGFPAGTTVVDVVPEGTSQGETAMAVVETIRDRGAEADFTVEVGGLAASTMDARDMIGDRVPWAIGVVVFATLVLLFLMTGSIAIPIKAVVMNVLSLGASFGALVWVFQDGNLSGLLGFDPVGSIDLWLPTIIFLFAFGLSMDYEVFLLGRIKEIHDRTGDNNEAVSLGLQKTGRIITSAAFLIVVVFTGFAAGETLTIKQLGVGLALAVIVDATIVRSLLVPATMKLLGEWNWWAPAPLRRLHDRFGLAEPAGIVHGQEDRFDDPRVDDGIPVVVGTNPKELVEAI
ncbi:MAG: MMPL family transporter [Acidimicrobiia bacterium]|nr:MMPL family transporter [Acidimicrobiia bacterium]